MPRKFDVPRYYSPDPVYSCRCDDCGRGYEQWMVWESVWKGEAKLESLAGSFCQSCNRLTLRWEWELFCFGFYFKEACGLSYSI